MEANPRHRGVIKRQHVHSDERGTASVRSNPSGGPSAEPVAAAPAVRLVQLDEHTQAFEFTCACGEVSLIEIQYEAKP
jgi:hypothetical protein